MRRIEFNRYKSFQCEHNISIDMTKDTSLVIGRNNSGKSSFIDIIGYSINNDDLINTQGFMDINLAFTLTENAIRSGFQENISGGGIPGINHYSYAKQFIGKEIIVELQIGNSLYGQGKNTKSFSVISIEGKECIDQYEASNWKNVAKYFLNYADDKSFRRINAERNIVPEEAIASMDVGYDGTGATNLIRLFVNDSMLDESYVEKRLLHELNVIMGEDSDFESIRVQQVSGYGDNVWEIFLKETGRERFALSKSGSGLKTVLLVLINLYLIPQLDTYKNKKIVYAFEELENNLHPALQRRLFEYIYNYSRRNDVSIFVTSHSHVAINQYYGKTGTLIYHVHREASISEATTIDNYLDKVEILDDLDVKASDILQSNGIIWVEGPSDRIYIKRCLEVFENCSYEEGQDYQFLYYGGRLLSHYEADYDPTEGLINILTTNRNSAIVIDSDKKSQQARINDTKKRVRAEFEKLNCMCWVTKGKEIENYISREPINRALESNIENDIGRYELFPDYICSLYSNFSSNKVNFAKRICEEIKSEADVLLDLKDQIHSLYEQIVKWNS